MGVAYTWSKTMNTIGDESTLTPDREPRFDYQLAAFSTGQPLPGRGTSFGICRKQLRCSVATRR